MVPSPALFSTLFVIGLGTAVPPDRYTQRECFDALQPSRLFESLQWTLLQRGSRGVLLALGDRCDWLWRAWFNPTR